MAGLHGSREGGADLLFAGAFARYYFTLGRGKPKEPITKLWYTWRGRIALCG
jgi:hypothetical protein